MKRFLLPLVLLLVSATGLWAQRSEPTDSLRVEALLDSCFTAGGRGDYAQAEGYLQQVLRLGPAEAIRPMLLNNLGGLQQLQGRDSAALASYTEALKLAPEDATTRFNRAQLFVRQRAYKAALTDFALLISAHPREDVYHYQRAMLYLLTKEYDLAEIDLRAIIDRNDKSLRARIGYALLETMRGRYTEAERLYDYLSSRLPKHPEVLEGRARMYLARKMRGYAQRAIEAAFEASKGRPSPTLYRLRAELLDQLGDARGAAEDRRQAQELETRPLQPTTKP